MTSLIGVLCVGAVGRQWITFCYIVERLIGCGALSINSSGFLGSPLVRCQIFSLAGGIGWGKRSSHIWNLVPLCLMWYIWGERNRQTFENLNRPDDQMLALFSGSLFDWVKTWGLTSSDSLPLFLSSLLLCS